MTMCPTPILKNNACYQINAAKITCAVFISLSTFLSMTVVDSALTNSTSQNQNARYWLDFTSNYTKQFETVGCKQSESIVVKFNINRWSNYAAAAVQTANLMTKLLSTNPSLVTLSFLFDMVRNNIPLESEIFGSAIALDKTILGLQAPYAYHGHNHTDVSVTLITYDYTTSKWDWYYNLSQVNWNYINSTKYKYDIANTSINSQYNPTVVQTDGFWTNPYFDCGGGNTWMVTYSSPILATLQTDIVFRGVATIDIDLAAIDINQCALSDNETSLDDGVFRGTDKCPNTTMCVPITGRGFVTGAYQCECLKGYYYPGMVDTGIAFNGTYLESLAQDQLKKLNCQRCAKGCVTCINSSPCLYERNAVLNIILLVIVSAEMLVIVVMCLALQIFSYKPVVKYASTPMLQLMNFGCLMTCVVLVLEYLDRSKVLCYVIPWFTHVGFLATFGAIILKIWRVKAVFAARQKDPRYVIPNTDLYNRLLALLALMSCYLIAYTVSSGHGLEILKTKPGLLFDNCRSSWWSYCVFIAEILCLIYGSYMCFKIRAAPIPFNDSKYVMWTIYNQIIIGSFVYIIREVMTRDYGPDLGYFLAFVYVEISAMGPFLFMYVPKFTNLDQVDDLVARKHIRSHIQNKEVTKQTEGPKKAAGS